MSRRFAAGLMVVLGSLMAADMALADEAPACKLKLLASLDITTTPNGFITVPVTVDDRELHFMVSLDGGFSSISLAAADSLKLTQHRSNVIHGPGGVLIDHYVTVPTFSIGKMKGDKLSFYVETATLGGTDGSLNADLMTRFDLDLDFAGGKIGLFSQDHCSGKVVYWTNDGVAEVPVKLTSWGGLTVPVTIDGKSITANLSTGATTSIMSIKDAKNYLNIDENSPGMVSESISLNGQVQKAYRYPFKALNFGDVAVSNPHILIVSDPNLTENLTLGMGILRQLHMYVAYKESKIYLTAASAH